MSHLFKVNLQLSDMFIRKIDFHNNIIEYQIFDQIGNPIEPRSNEKFTIDGDKIRFGNRFLNINLARGIGELLLT